jgi:hypothetical protein
MGLVCLICRSVSLILSFPFRLRINLNFIHSSSNCKNQIVDFLTNSTGKGGEDFGGLGIVNFVGG